MKTILWALLLALVAGIAQAEPVVPQLQRQPAERLATPARERMLAATRAGERLVAVGDHGVVLLSDDQGRSFRQAREVPVRSALTAVSFADAQHGWAVGHWGVVLHTRDGGEHWTLQRSDTRVDQPLFSVHFKDAREGWAVGLWALMLHTLDGGATWTPVALPADGSQRMARNLYAIFADPAGRLFIAAEQGHVARSADGGRSWDWIDTGYAGSFWTGLALHDGTLLVAGLRGTVYRSSDGGRRWQPAQTPLHSSLTSLLQDRDGRVLAVGLDGVLLQSDDGGRHFASRQRADRVALTAVVQAGDGRTVLFSARGVAPPY